MYKKQSQQAFRLLFTVMFLAAVSAASAQNNTNSPYTRFGYGKLFDSGFGRSQSMGGVSYGLRSKSTINAANPAAYSAMDSTSLLFEIGVSGLLSNFSAAGSSTSKFTGNLEYLAMQFPVTRRFGVSVGVMPYSYVGYNYGFSDSTRIQNPVADTAYIKQAQQFSGQGGISQAYLGLSFNWKRLSIGVNGYYMFGAINHLRAVNITSSEGHATYTSTQTAALHIHNFNTRFGLQYRQPLKNNHALTIGAVYEFQTKMNGDYSTSTIGIDSTIITSSELFDLPAIYGLGLTYSGDRLTVGADATLQQFAGARYFSRTDTLSNRMKVSVGAEYTHRPNGLRYIDRMNWRIGANYSNSYIKVGGRNTNDFSLTCGVGFPLRTIKTVINVLFEYGHIGASDYSMLRERYFKFGLNVSLNERWFFKSVIR
jgi:hypothetical protein